MATPPLTAPQLQQYEESGFVMLDAPLCGSELDSAEAAHDRCAVHGGGGGGGGAPAAPRTEDEGYVRALSHPFFERVAQQVLRSRRVHLVEDLPHYRAPAEDTEDPGWDPHAAWAGGCHIDWQVTTTDFCATPRRDMCAIWLWLTDVEPERAAMRIMPKSHAEISAHWQRTLHPARQSMLPRNYGLFPRPSHNYPTYPQHIVEPAHFQYTELEPTAVVARRGQALVFTQSMLHAVREQAAATDTINSSLLPWCRCVFLLVEAGRRCARVCRAGATSLRTLARR